MKIKFFSTGAQTGNSKVFNDSDLEEIKNNYNSQLHENKDKAPLVIGHPSNDSPSFGWVDKIEKVGNWLVANIIDTSKEIIDKISDNQYKYVSASIRDNNTLKHIGLVPVAQVKGTEILEFTDKENDKCYIFDFNEFRGKEMEEKIKELEKIIADKDKLISDLEKKTSDFSESIKKQNTEIDSMRKSISDIHQKAKQKDINDFCEKMLIEGKLTPAEKELELKTLTALSYVNDFSEETSVFNQRKKAITEKKSILSTQKIEVNNFSEFDAMAIEKEASKICKEQGIPYDKAIQQVYLERTK